MEGYSRQQCNLRINTNFVSPYRQQFFPKKHAAPSGVSALSSHSNWASTTRSTQCPAQRPVSLRLVIAVQEAEESGYYTGSSSSESSPTSPCAHSLNSDDGYFGGQQLSPRQSHDESHKHHQAYMEMPTCITKVPEFWHESDESFNSKLPQMTLRELAQLGRMAAEDESFIDEGSTNLDAKLCAYYSEIYRRLEHPTAEMSLDWLNEVLKATKKGTYYNNALMRRVCDHIKRLVDLDSPISITTAMAVLGIASPMILSGFYDPIFIKAAGHYAKNLHYIKISNMNSALSNVRALCILHAMSAEQTGEELDALSEHIECLINRLDDRAYRMKMTQTMDSMQYWINLYGYHVLNLDIPIPHLRFRELKGNISPFQERVERELLALSPNLPLQREVTLHRTRLSADLFLRPDIVIEVDGHSAHSSKELLLKGVTGLGQSNHPGANRENGKTIIKRRILEGAGYTVFNVTDCKPQTIQDLDQKLKDIWS